MDIDKSFEEFVKFSEMEKFMMTMLFLLHFEVDDFFEMIDM